MAFGTENLETDPPARPSRTAGRALGHAALGGGIPAIALGAQVLLEDLLPHIASWIQPSNIPLVAAMGVSLAGVVLGVVFGHPRVRAILALGLVALTLGCFAKLGPLFVGVGAVETCSGDYAYDDATGRYRREGEWTSGAAISDTGARAIGVVGDAAVRVGTAMGGVPIQPPRPAPKDTGP